LVGHRLPDVTESIGERLQAMAIGGDGEVALDDGAELRLEVDSVSHLVVEEEVADERVGLVRGLVLRHDDVEDLLADGAIEPRADDEVLATPLGVTVGGRSVGGDVAGELVPTEENADEHAPLGVVRRLEVEDDRDVRLDACDVDGEGGWRGGRNHGSGEGVRGHGALGRGRLRGRRHGGGGSYGCLDRNY
jgi:hypothetical protein